MILPRLHKGVYREWTREHGGGLDENLPEVLKALGPLDWENTIVLDICYYRPSQRGNVLLEPLLSKKPLDVMDVGYSPQAMEQALAVGACLVAAGRAKHVLIVGWYGRALRALKSRIDWGLDACVDLTEPVGNGLLAKLYLEAYQYGREVFTKVGMKNRMQGADFGAPHTKPVIYGECYNSPLLVEPLRKTEMAVGVEGVGAVLLGVEGTSVSVCRGVGKSPWDLLADPKENLLTLPAIVQAVEGAGLAGQSLADFDAVCVDDRYASLELLSLEALGLVPRGQAGAMIASGKIKAGKAPMVNPDGGCLAWGREDGLDLLRQMVHLHQLLPPGGRGLCHMNNPLLSEATVVVMEKPGG